MDKIKQKLQENYEEACFALLMDEYAQLEGDRLLSEYKQVESAPAFQTPNGMIDRGIKLIRREFRRKNIRNAISTVYKPLTRVAIIVLALNIFFIFSFFSIEAFRVEVLNMALQFQDTHTSVRFVDPFIEAETADYSLEDIQHVIPDSFSVVLNEDYGEEKHYEFSNNNGESIKWNQFPISTEISIDTEDAEYVETISIGGYDGIIVEKNDRSSILWGDTDKHVLYYCIADLSKEDLLSIILKLTE